jgi:hypothetical protein
MTRKILIPVAAIAVVLAVVLVVRAQREDFVTIDGARAAVLDAQPDASITEGPKVDGRTTLLVALPTADGVARVAVAVAKDPDGERNGLPDRLEHALDPGWGNGEGCANWSLVSRMPVAGPHDLVSVVERALNGATPAKWRCGP